MLFILVLLYPFLIIIKYKELNENVCKSNGSGHCMYIDEWRSALSICNYPRYIKSELV